MAKDYYGILGVNRKADTDKIKRAYRSRVKELHPDVSHSECSADRFREVQEAYETLADQEKRRQYDEELQRQEVRDRASECSPSLSSTSAPRVRDLGVDPFATLSTLVDYLLGNQWPFAALGASAPEVVRADLILSRREAAQGGTFSLRLPWRRPCVWCGGHGGWWRPCPQCGGTGQEQTAYRLEVTIPPGVTPGTELSCRLDRPRPAGVELRLTVLVQGR